MSSHESETRKRILEETWHLMEKRRGQGVRLEDIARAAGVSRQAVYLHFGSRTGLMIATARYLDEVLGLSNRLKFCEVPQGGAEFLDNYISFWGNYIPDIYGLAKAFLLTRETDEAAAAAWEDRMQAVYNGCVGVVRCLKEEGSLAPEWTIEEAAEFFWAALSVETWETLTRDCGWSKDQYIARLQMVLKNAFLKST